MVDVDRLTTVTGVGAADNVAGLLPQRISSAGAGQIAINADLASQPGVRGTARLESEGVLVGERWPS